MDRYLEEWEQLNLEIEKLEEGIRTGEIKIAKNDELIEIAETVIAQTKERLKEQEYAKKLKGFGWLKEFGKNFLAGFKNIYINLKEEGSLKVVLVMYIVCEICASLMLFPFIVTGVVLSCILAVVSLYSILPIIQEKLKYRKSSKEELENLIAFDEKLIKNKQKEIEDYDLEIEIQRALVAGLESQVDLVKHEKEEVSKEREVVIGEVAEQVINQEYEVRRTRKKGQK